MAGLRRYLAAPRLKLLDIQPLALPVLRPGGIPEVSDAIRGMSVGVEIDGVARRLALVLKEAPVSEGGRVLSAVGWREYGVYERLAPHLPVLVPGLVAGDSFGWQIWQTGETQSLPCPRHQRRHRACGGDYGQRSYHRDQHGSAGADL